MKQINVNILRVTLVISYIAIIAMIIWGIAGVYAYLNTGADRSNMLHTEVKKVEQYLPKLKWAPLLNEGRPMDAQTLKSIESDYLDAWYVKHVAYKTNTTLGIEDYYTENARASIYTIIEDNEQAHISIDGTTLEHHLTLDFFSEDGQLITLTDTDVLEYKRVYQNSTLVLETREVSTYKIVMLLEDGFWRIRHLIKEGTKPYDAPYNSTSNTISNIKGINYYPQDSPWNMYDDAFDEHIISKDFKIIADAGLNSIRIFVPYKDFGSSNIKSDKLKKLKTVLDIAGRYQLKVLVTLFDFYGDYEVINWSLNQHHAIRIVSELKHHEALLGWDIKNEPNLDFESRGKTKVLAWAEQMIATVKSEDSLHPITIGWSNAESALLLKNQLDFVSFHFYEDLINLEQVYQQLKSETANKPIVITEFGISSYRGLWRPFVNSKEDQAEYHKEAQRIVSKTGIQTMSWTLYDFTEIPKEVVGRLPWRKEAQGHFGFIDQNGETKPAFKYISKE